MGLPKKSVAKMATAALVEGHGQDHFIGSFRKYLDKLGRTYHTYPIVYKGHIFIFARAVLITTFPVPVRYTNYKPRKPDSLDDPYDDD